jgi:SNF2 family DNA or RNA helicase
MIGSDPGTGKTYCVLTYINSNRPNPGEYIGVLAPKSICEAAWADDAAKFTPDLPVFIGLGSRAKKKAAIAKAREVGGVVVTNHDSVDVLYEERDGLVGLAIDESTAFKNRKAKRTKVALSLAKLPSIRMSIPMSGTPTPQTVMDIWSQIELAKPGFLPNFMKLRQELQTPVAQPLGGRTIITWQDKHDANLWLSTAIEPIFIRYSKDECLDLPEQSINTMQVTLSNKLRELYTTFKNDAVLELQSGDVDAVNAAVLANKLLQISSGFAYGADGAVHNLSPERYELVMDIIEERGCAVVACPLSAQIDALQILAEARGLRHGRIDGSVSADERAKVSRGFQEGEYDVLFCNPKAAGHGLTFTRSRTIIWVSPTFSSELFLQFNARIDRIGQQHKNEVILIQAKGTYEEKAYAILTGKVGRQLDLLELLQ